ncbi:MAG: sulfotransferase [Proteobacteria bacterium]|nr:sulfotransferase [Pseudomonadota bacterium]
MSVERQWARIHRYQASGQSDAARTALEALLAKDPHDGAAHLMLASLLYARDCYRDCARHAVLGAEHVAGDITSIVRAVNALLQVGEVAAARACLGHPVIANCTSGPVLTQLAGMRQLLGEHESAMLLLDRARALGHDGADFRFVRGVQLMFNGRLDEAEHELDACLAMGTQYGRAAVTRARLRTQSAASNHVDDLRRRIAGATSGSEDRAAFEYALYKELDDLGDHSAAWGALARGAAIMAQRHPHDAAAESTRIDRLCELIDADFVSRGAAGTDAGPMPIFVIGMPRSGTTLLDRLLGTHPRVESAGELGDFARALRWAADHFTNQPVDEVILERAADLDYAALGQRYLAQTRWRAHGKPFYVDKLPVNWIQAGFIARALPQAKILHMVRPAMDVCYSNYRAYFGPGYAYSYAFDRLAAHYRDYRRTLAHWRRVMPERILDVDYAHLVGNVETVAREVLEFCGLPFASPCLGLAANRNAVATLSAVQVREPLHDRAMGAWRRYAAQLSPLRDLLGDLAH